MASLAPSGRTGGETPIQQATDATAEPTPVLRLVFVERRASTLRQKRRTENQKCNRNEDQHDTDAGSQRVRQVQQPFRHNPVCPRARRSG